MNHRFGIVVPPAIGHLNPMVALALELMRRHHDVVLFTVADGARKLSGLPLEVVTIGTEAFPPATLMRPMPSSADSAAWPDCASRWPTSNVRWTCCTRSLRLQ